jgi:hypothetical protein
MKDFPVFTTEYGVASLILREIPYQGTAYVRIQSSLDPENLVKECLSFCRMVGAERVYATGDPFLETYPFHTAMLRMVCHRDSIGETDAALWPVQEHTADEFRRIFNQKTPSILNGAWMTEKDTKEMLQTGEGYFVHRNGNLLGIGRIFSGELRFVASVSPGAGADVVKALCSASAEDSISLTVASANRKAMSLYEGLGFTPVEELSRWFRLL